MLFLLACQCEERLLIAEPNSELRHNHIDALAVDAGVLQHTPALHHHPTSFVTHKRNELCVHVELGGLEQQRDESGIRLLRHIPLHLAQRLVFCGMSSRRDAI